MSRKGRATHQRARRGHAQNLKIRYVSIEAAETTPGDAAKPYDPLPAPAPRPNPARIAVGDRATFDDGK